MVGAGVGKTTGWVLGGGPQGGCRGSLHGGCWGWEDPRMGAGCGLIGRVLEGGAGGSHRVGAEASLWLWKFTQYLALVLRRVTDRPNI